MSINAGILPYSYGDLISISHDGPRTLLWFLSKDGSIRGVPLDLSDPKAPKLGGENEILVKRGGVNDSTARVSLTPSTKQVLRPGPTA